MSEKDPIPYEDIYSLKRLFKDLQIAFANLRQATYDDAALGYPAILHHINPDTLHPDERTCHPWCSGDLKLLSEYPIHEQAISGIEDIWFNDSANSQHTFNYPGVILCRPETLSFVDTVNNAKNTFKKRVLDLKAKYKELTDSDIENELRLREGEWASLTSAKLAFNKAGLGRICIKHVYRNIPTIRQQGLARAKHYYNNKRPSRPRTVAKQLEIFQKRIDKGETNQDIIHAITTLQTMNPELVISERQNSNEIITVNYKIQEPFTGNGGKWSQVSGALPIYCLGNPAMLLTKLVDFSSLDTPFNERERLKKEKVREGQLTWSETSFLPAFRLYLPLE